uniref:Uncharacterized protein n=1 Tax=Oryza punctata TaxID=4537 RepID=A0A0E0JHC4_ORYPU
MGRGGWPPITDRARVRRWETGSEGTRGLNERDREDKDDPRTELGLRQQEVFYGLSYSPPAYIYPACTTTTTTTTTKVLSSQAAAAAAATRRS